MTNLKTLYANFSLTPLNGKVPLLKEWTKGEFEKIPFDKLKAHKGNFGVVCGFGGLEVIDIDNHFFDAKENAEFIWNNYDLSKFFITKTGSDGFHIYYKCEEIEANQKLANKEHIENDESKHIIEGKNRYLQPPNGKKLKLLKNSDNNWVCIDTMIETRGSGGQVVFYDKIISGSIGKITVISTEERDKLLNVCKSLNEVAKKNSINANENKKVNGQRPGDKYANDPDTIQETYNLLIEAGWTTKNNLNWFRPGKEFKEGPSATFGKIGKNTFYNFSPNAPLFPLEESCSMMRVRTILKHNGNYSACAKELADIYGMTQQQPEEEKGKKPRKTRWSILEKIIKDWKLKFRYNELTTVIDVSHDGEEYQKLGLLAKDIVREMETKRGITTISASKVSEMIETSKTCESYNPIKEFFKSIPEWDGVDYFAELEKYIKLDPDEKKDFCFPMLKKHLIRALKCALVSKYINRMVFTFHGPQEIGKSMFFRWLAPDDLYNEEPIIPGDKDSILSLARYIMINMDELDSLNNKDVAKLKAFISRGEITKRVAYGRHDERFSRIASLVASTNKDDVLADEKNTRWLIVKIKDFDWKGYVKNINPLQIWAQCYAELKKDTDAGELTSEEKTERDIRNDTQFLVTSSEREILMKYFKEGTSPVTATDIKHTIENKLYPLKMNFHQLLRELKRQFGDPSKPKFENDKKGRYYYMDSNLFDALPTPGFCYEPETEEIKQGDLPF